MKRILSFAMAMLLLGLSFKDLVVYTVFTLDRQYIIDNYCVNKARPELMCSGKCFLDEQIALDKDQKESVPGVQFQLKYHHTEYLPAPANLPQFSRSAEGETHNYHDSSEPISSYQTDIFHPPIA
ncbi:MAG: hypothetical protein KDC57_08250 [Saprospiraceae bacterium]|nr:hypothetical protein [Saprospiraceae bacterium]